MQTSRQKQTSPDAHQLYCTLPSGTQHHSSITKTASQGCVLAIQFIHKLIPVFNSVLIKHKQHPVDKQLSFRREHTSCFFCFLAFLLNFLSFFIWSISYAFVFVLHCTNTLLQVLHCKKAPHLQV